MIPPEAKRNGYLEGGATLPPKKHQICACCNQRTTQYPVNQDQVKHTEKKKSSKNGGTAQNNKNKVKTMILSWPQSTRRLASLGPNPLQTPLFLHCLFFARQTRCLILMESGAINVLIATIELARRVNTIVHLCARQSEYIVPSIDYCSNI